MVDPKRVELGQYNGVPHLLTKVITNPKRAAEALKWAVSRDGPPLRPAGGRQGARHHRLPGEVRRRASSTEDGFDRFPYIVVIVDELNDLMMVAGRRWRKP